MNMKGITGGLIGSVLLSTLACNALADVSLFGQMVTAQPGTQVDVNVTVDGFLSLVSAQGSMQWNPSIVSFAGVSNYGALGLSASNFGTSQSSSGRLSFSWNDGTLNGVNLADDSLLYKIRFNVTGSAGASSPFAFTGNPTPLEFIDSDFTPVPIHTSNGSITVIPEPSGLLLLSLGIFCCRFFSRSARITESRVFSAS